MAMKLIIRALDFLVAELAKQVTHCNQLAAKYVVHAKALRVRAAEADKKAYELSIEATKANVLASKIKLLTKD